jgi:hypothetical protein
LQRAGIKISEHFSVLFHLKASLMALSPPDHRRAIGANGQRPNGPTPMVRGEEGADKISLRGRRERSFRLRRRRPGERRPGRHYRHPHLSVPLGACQALCLLRPDRVWVAVPRVAHVMCMVRSPLSRRGRPGGTPRPKVGAVIAGSASAGLIALTRPPWSGRGRCGLAPLPAAECVMPPAR